jgi:hypothetical protein
LATEELIERFKSSYLEIVMKPEATDVSEDLNLQMPAHPDALDVLRGAFGSGDLGVSEFSHLTSRELRSLLGWPNDRDGPFLLPFRHADGHTEFDKGKEGLFQHLDPCDLDPPHPFTTQRLQWHQLLGIASMIRRLFSPSEHSPRCGVLLADEVGIGKTAQGLGLIAFLAQVVMGRKQQLRDPKILCMLDLRNF